MGEVQFVVVSEAVSDCQWGVLSSVTFTLNTCRRTVLSDEEECPYDTLGSPETKGPDEPIYDSPKSRVETETDKKTGEVVYETIPSKTAGDEEKEEGGVEDPLYDAIPQKPPNRKISTEIDGFLDQFHTPRTRTHAYSMVRPKVGDASGKNAYEMVDIKQAKLSTDTSTSPDKPVKYTVVHREDVLKEEDDEIYNVPSLVKPAGEVEGEYDDIYQAPSLQKPQPPSRPVPKLPEMPTRRPPPVPPPAKPPRTDIKSDDSEYVVQDPDKKLVSNGEYLGHVVQYPELWMLSVLVYSLFNVWCSSLYEYNQLFPLSHCDMALWICMRFPGIVLDRHRIPHDKHYYNITLWTL